MKYISTRGNIAPIGFKDAVMMGLATDGGLILPESIPKLDADTLVVSIVAGARLEALRAGLSHAVLVRAMPNTPARVAMAATVWTASAEPVRAWKMTTRLSFSGVSVPSR